MVPGDHLGDQQLPWCACCVPDRALRPPQRTLGCVLSVPWVYAVCCTNQSPSLQSYWLCYSTHSLGFPKYTG